MGSMSKDVTHPNCPDSRLLEEVAAGTCSPEVERQTVRHISQCEQCGPRFRALLRIESPAPMSASEAAIFKQLKTSNPEYQKRWATGHGLVPPPDARRAGDKPNEVPVPVAHEHHHEPKWWPRLAFAAAGLSALVVLFLFVPAILAKMELARAGKQVNVAFAERRTPEMRYSGAPAAPFRPFPVELGPDTPAVSDFDRPELARAQGIVADKVKSGDPKWLQLQGRISLLKGDARSLGDAERMFEAAEKKDPNSASIKIDLATAYFEHDSKSEHPNLQRTLDLLLQVLHHEKLNKDDRSTALFDLAIAYEKTQAWDMAVDAWKKYLEVDGSGPWAEEVKQRLKDAESRTQQKRQQGYDAPKNLLDQVAQGTLRPEEPEQYFQKALTLWLPLAVKDPNSDYYRATAQLAEVMEQRSSDTWLRDFLRGVRARDATAVEALSAASVANEKGLYEAGAEQAHRALDAFKASKNSAGMEIAQFEQVYATRSLLKGKDCLEPAGRLRSALDRTHHQWLRAQAHLEEAQCHNFAGELAASDSSAASSMTIAEDYHLPVMVLRNMGIVASMKRQQNKLDESWDRGVQGLGLYWKGNYPADRLDQFYSVMFQDAEKSGFSFVATDLVSHVLTLRESATSPIQKNLIREATLHLVLGKLLNARKETELASTETKKAAAILDSAAESSKRLSLIVNIGIGTAGNARRDLNSVLAMKPLLAASQDKIIILSYQRLLGNIYLSLHQFDEAGAAYQAAVRTAEASLGTLANEKDRTTWLHSTDDVYRGMVRVLLAQHKDREALETWEWYKGRAELFSERRGTNLREANSQQPMGPIQSMPKGAGTRLIYAGFADGLQAWVVTGDRITSKWTPLDLKHLDDSVRSFSGKCANPDSSLKEIQQEGAELYGLLLQPVRDQLSESKLVVELDPTTYNLPMEALRSPEGNYFGERYSVVYSPGVWVENNLRAAREIASQESLLLLDASRVSYLPGMEGERKSISALFPKTKLVNSVSTSATEFKAQLTTSEIFHFMGHGQQDGSGTHLVLSDRLTLGAKDFTPEVLQHSRLVVLSACSTGRGEKDGYLDTDSLVHSFLAAGVPTIVSSHWNVDSASSAQLMTSFYSHLVTDKQPGLAMYNARKEILSANTHPYYWAGFSVVGRAL